MKTIVICVVLLASPAFAWEDNSPYPNTYCPACNSYNQGAIDQEQRWQQQMYDNQHRQYNPYAPFADPNDD